MQTTKPHAALLASPGMGHVIPILELGKRLVSHHGFLVTVFVVGTDDQTKSQLHIDYQKSNLLRIVLFPSVDISALGVDPSASISNLIHIMMKESLPLLREAISEMKSPPEMLVVDLFGTKAFSIADEFKMLKYVLDTSTAWFLAVTIYTLVVHNKAAVVEHVNDKKPLKIPGCKPLQFEDSFIDRTDVTDPVYEEFLSSAVRMTKADGILVNTWQDLESTTLQALTDDSLMGPVVKAPVYPVGPLARAVGSSCLAYPVLDWLDMQPNKSVLYVSFGSGGTLSAEQMIELAWGLELSQQRFVWIIRPPKENDASGSFFTVGNGHDGDQPDYLPLGFLSRTRDVGLVVPLWAPQPDILGHTSVGGFLSHCGWNSALESLINGVPMIAWPLYSEQKMNAKMLTEELGVAIRSKEWPSNGVVIKREEIKMMVRKIMVDKKDEVIRNRAKELKRSAEKALSEGGSSYNSLSQVRKKCEISLHCLKPKASQGA